VQEYEERAAAHRARLAPYVEPHLARRDAGIKHPVHDFLFTYYSQRPAQLMRWHPGFGAVSGNRHLAEREAHSQLAYIEERRPLITQLHELLAATASRPGNFGCFGLHEWAMVHRADTTRHPVPLRLGAAETDAVTESHKIACSHFDAFRFFTPTAVGMNTLSPGSRDRPAFEQPGCLHGGMDLYGKVAVRLSPMISSDLVADAFELAWDIRILDMRAAPYDMTGYTLDPTGEQWTPVKIETPEGKAEYVSLQRKFSERAAPIRAALIGECERLLGATVGS
jgi:hypothetical protein